MRDAAAIIAFIDGQPDMLRLLRAVEEQNLPDCWIGAGFVRNSVWDAIHGRAGYVMPEDIDVIFFDPMDTMPERETAIEASLAKARPGVPWSVKNQARMHRRNDDPPYADSLDALRHWPETCTAIGARRIAGHIELLTPFGVDDLLGLIVRPTPRHRADPAIYRERGRKKNWNRRWPLVRVEE